MHLCCAAYYFGPCSHHDNDYTLFKADWTSTVKNEMK